MPSIQMVWFIMMIIDDVELLQSDDDDAWWWRRRVMPDVWNFLMMSDNVWVIPDDAGWWLMMQDDDWWCLVTPGEEVRGRAVLKYIKTNTTTNPNDCATKPKIYQISVWYPAYRCPGGVGLNRANLILAQAVKLYRYRVKHAVKDFTTLSPTHACEDFFLTFFILIDGIELGKGPDVLWGIFFAQTIVTAF